MSENTADVVQGTLGWEPGDVSTANVDELTPHPKNEDIYGADGPAGDIAESVRENGVLEPLVIKSDKTIISGHRRWRAARETGIGRVPVRVAEFESELDEREALIEFNRQREKTFSQKMAEADEIREIVEQRAKERQGERTDLVDEFPQGADGRGGGEANKSRDEIAEKVGIGSGRTYDKARTVWDAANDGDETAQEQVEKIDSGNQTITGAKKAVEKEQRKSEDEERRARQRETFRAAVETSEAVQLHHGEFQEVLAAYDDESIDHIVTDPPYNEDALEDVAPVFVVESRGDMLADDPCDHRFTVKEFVQVVDLSTHPPDVEMRTVADDLSWGGLIDHETTMVWERERGGSGGLIEWEETLRNRQFAERDD